MNRFLAIMGILGVAVSAVAAPAGNINNGQKTKQPLARDTYYKSGYYLGLNMGRAKADMVLLHFREITLMFYRSLSHLLRHFIFRTNTSTPIQVSYEYCL